jgi:hypothetical protein
MIERRPAGTRELKAAVDSAKRPLRLLQLDFCFGCLGLRNLTNCIVNPAHVTLVYILGFLVEISRDKGIFISSFLGGKAI